MERNYTNQHSLKGPGHLVFPKDAHHLHADRLGSGVRKLFKYSKFYSGKDPIFQDGDIFRTIVPLDDEYSFDYRLGNNTDVMTDGKTDAMTDGKTDAKFIDDSFQRLTDTESKILEQIKENPTITQRQLANRLELSDSGVRYAMRELKEKGLLTRVGSNRNGGWKLIS